MGLFFDLRQIMDLSSIGPLHNPAYQIFMVRADSSRWEMIVNGRRAITKTKTGANPLDIVGFSVGTIM